MFFAGLFVAFLVAMNRLGVRRESSIALEALERRLDDCVSPLSRLEEGLQPWVAFGIIPLFALANAGVSLSGLSLASLLSPASRAIILGLFVGNQLVGSLLSAITGVLILLKRTPANSL